MKLFVGSLPFDLTEDELKELFEQYGPVNSVRIVVDRDTKRSRGFGFVEMSNQDDGKKAMDELNGSNLNGRSIVVNAAHENERRRR